jgi:hypothetical protein
MSRLLHFQAAIALLLLSEPSCRKRQIAVPLPQAPAASSQPLATQPQASQPSANAPAPKSSGPAAASQSSAPKPAPAATGTTKAQSNPYQVNLPPQTASPAPRKSNHPARAANESPSPQPSQPEQGAKPVAAPQLVDIVTPDQQRQWNAASDQSLSHAQASLAGIANRQLTKDQQGSVEQIRNIMQQAQASRKSDLPGAKSLAERAEVLAKDLAASFH